MVARFSAISSRSAALHRDERSGIDDDIQVLPFDDRRERAGPKLAKWKSNFKVPVKNCWIFCYKIHFRTHKLR